MFKLSHINILGVNIHSVLAKEVVLTIEQWLNERGEPRMICTPNADLIMKARRDRDFLQILNHADLSLPDGMGVVYASRILGQPLAETVTGRLIPRDLCRIAADRGWSVFFLGGKPGSAKAAAERLQHAYPKLMVAGYFCPRFEFALGDEEDRKAVEIIKRARPNILYVGLGAPKQEKWIKAHLEEIKVPVSIGVGYAFDILGGLVKEPPRWMTRVGLEWLVRLLKEPRRLWRRYLVDGMIFIGLVLQSRWRCKRSSEASLSKLKHH
jgi:N-acetylglucosaminyldiphosphoundecaprenol N-acetyl-beta-D-mannosaminyltransferase